VRFNIHLRQAATSRSNEIRFVWSKSNFNVLEASSNIKAKRGEFIFSPFIRTHQARERERERRERHKESERRRRWRGIKEDNIKRATTLF
jgi:hypothetical protein